MKPITQEFLDKAKENYRNSTIRNGEVVALLSIANAALKFREDGCEGLRDVNALLDSILSGIGPKGESK